MEKFIFAAHSTHTSNILSPGRILRGSLKASSNEFKFPNGSIAEYDTQFPPEVLRFAFSLTHARMVVSCSPWSLTNCLKCFRPSSQMTFQKCVFTAVCAGLEYQLVVSQLSQCLKDSPDCLLATTAKGTKVTLPSLSCCNGYTRMSVLPLWLPIHQCCAAGSIQALKLMLPLSLQRHGYIDSPLAEVDCSLIKHSVIWCGVRLSHLYTLPPHGHWK